MGSVLSYEMNQASEKQLSGELAGDIIESHCFSELKYILKLAPDSGDGSGFSVETKDGDETKQDLSKQFH